MFNGKQKIIFLSVATAALLVFLGVKMDIQRVSAGVLPIIVHEEHLSFGTVFPGEQLSGNFGVHYVQDYIEDGITYKIIFKRKPLPEVYQGTGDPDLPGFYRDLCPFLTPVNVDPGETDTVNQAFVGQNDLSDDWRIDLKVPAIFGHVSQDHTGGVVSSEGDYGCDISIDVIPPECNPDAELVANGGFETPVVQNPALWDVFPSGYAGLNWLVEWRSDIAASYGADAKPAVANLELHRGVLGPAYAGSQYAELDTDWYGPSSGTAGEPASVKIHQEIATVPGRNYQLKFAFTPRPNTLAGDNVLEVRWNGSLVATLGPVAGGGGNAWTLYTYPVTAAGTSAVIEFTDLGTANSLGTFLDEVSLKCVLPV